jgi:hypothetical protein
MISCFLYFIAKLGQLFIYNNYLFIIIIITNNKSLYFYIKYGKIDKNKDDIEF